jgi:hypothetical protein
MDERDDQEMRDPLGYRVRGLHYHPRSPDASLEELRRLAGIIKLNGPVPSRKFLDEDEEGSQVNARD